MGALAATVGKTIMYEYRLKMLFKPGHQQMMHHAVAKISGQYFTRLGMKRYKTGGAGGMPGSLLKRLGGIDKVIEQPHFIPLGFACATLAAPAGLPGPIQRSKVEGGARCKSGFTHD
jgi:hypothetical protein